MAYSLDGKKKIDDRVAISNLVMYEHGITGSEWCKICNSKRIILSKAQLLGVGLSEGFNKRVSERCDDETGYSFCSKCCSVIFEPTSLQPNEWVKKVGVVMCVKCMLGQTNQRLTYSPKFMLEDANNEQSKKRWYWHCSNCNHREEMSQSNLTKTHYTENKTFIKSIGSKEKIIDKELPEGARLVDGRDIPPPI